MVKKLKPHIALLRLPIHKYSIEQVLGRSANPNWRKGCEQKKRQQRIAPTPNHTRPHIDNLIPLDIPIRKLIIPKKKKNPLRVCLVGVKSGWMENKKEKNEEKMVGVAVWLGGERKEKTG